MRINPEKSINFLEGLGQLLNAFLNVFHSRSIKCISMNATHT
jgi:hypothetical protein